MSDLVITITDAGRAEVINAVNTGTAPVLIASIGIGSGKYTPSPTQTALKTPIKTLTTFGGEAVSPDVIHVSIQDKSTDAYQMNEFGLFTDKGTLFAVYSQVDAVILEKTAKSILLLSTDIALKTLEATDITFGDTEFVNPPATETVKGVVELATDGEAQAGTDKERVITPSALKSVTASEERAGLIKIGSQSEVTAGASTTLAVTPKTLQGAGDGRYLKKSNSLSEIKQAGAEAQKSARDNLGLGTAATKNVGTEGGNVMQVGAFGLGSGSNHKANAYNNAGEIYRVNNTSENAPTTGVAGVVSLPCDGGPSTAYVAVSNAGAAWVGSSNVPANGVKWNRVYTTGYKPSAADVAAADVRNNFAARMGVSRVLNGATGPSSPGVWSVENSTWAGVPWGSVICTTNGSDLSTTGGGGRFNHYLQISHEEAGKPGLRVAVNINGAFSGWERVYTTAYKPTAADVGAVASKNGTASMLNVTDELRINTNAKLYRDGGKFFIEARYDDGTEPSYFSFSPGDGTFRAARGYFETDIRIGGESIRIYKENNDLWFNVSGQYFGFQNDGVFKAGSVYEGNNRVYSPGNPQPPNLAWEKVGSYAFAMYGGNGNINFNDVVSGSNLYPSGAAGSAGGATLAGSWRCMGISTTVNDAYRSTLWMRVS